MSFRLFILPEYVSLSMLVILISQYLFSIYLIKLLPINPQPPVIIMCFIICLSIEVYWVFRVLRVYRVNPANPMNSMNSTNPTNSVLLLEYISQHSPSAVYSIPDILGWQRFLLRRLLIQGNRLFYIQDI